MEDNLILELAIKNGVYIEKVKLLAFAQSIASALQPERISVEDRLPSDFQGVLAYGLLRGDKERSWNESYYTSNDAEFNSVRNGQTTVKSVTHWMPLPPIQKEMK